MKAVRVGVGLLVVVALGGIDYATGFELSFSIFYLIPIAFVSWTVGRRAGTAVAFAAAATWLLMDLLGGHPYSDPVIPYWNAGVRLGFFLVVVSLLVARKRLGQELQHTIAELEGTLATIKTLKGLVPICAYCKKIRDDQGFWNKVESYIHAHSEADFTYSLCPACEEGMRDQRSGGRASQP